MSDLGGRDASLDTQQSSDEEVAEQAPVKIGHYTQVDRLVQRIGTGAGPSADVTSSALQMLQHGPPGVALADDVRRPVEQITGGDLGCARVHTGAGASAAASQLEARAFTYGSDIYLGAGESTSDRALMAHEATHAVQQSGASASPQAKSVDIASPTDASEVEADRVADAVVAGHTAPMAVSPAGTAPARIARKPVNHTTTPTAAPAAVPDDTTAAPSSEEHKDDEGNTIQKSNGHWYLAEEPKTKAFPAAGGRHELYPINPNASFAALHAAVVAAQAEQLAFSKTLKGDMKYWFCKVYYFVTTHELAAIAAGTYQYPHMKLQEVLSFHATYKANLTAWEAGNKGKVEAQWREAFSAAENGKHWYDTRSVEIMHALLPSMQAHIRFDLPRAIASCYVTHYAGIPGTSIGDFLPDFNAMGPVFDAANASLLPEIKADTGVLDPGRYGTLQDIGFPFLFNVPMERQHTWEKATALSGAMGAGMTGGAYERNMRNMTTGAHPFSGSDDFEVNGENITGTDWMHQPGAKADAAGPADHLEPAVAPPPFPERLYFKLDHPHTGEKLENAIRDDQDLAPYKALAEWTRQVRTAELYLESHVSSEGPELHNQELTGRRLGSVQNFMYMCGADFDNNNLNQAAVGPAGAEPKQEWRYVMVAVRSNGTGRQEHHTPNANLPSEVNKKK